MPAAAPIGAHDGRRTYGQACPIAHALDLIGERWALLVVRELRLGPRRYADIQAALPGLGPSVLAQRLRDLEAVGVLRRRVLPPPASAKVYELTEWGAELEPVFAALRVWGMRSPVVPLRGDVGSDTVLLGLRAYFVARPRAPWTAAYRIDLGRETYRVVVVDGELVTVARGEDPTAPAPDVHVVAETATLQSVLTGKVPLASALADAGLTVTGDTAALERLVEALPAR
ncbi:winged helix-turn-helix transcriptional regulator [Embleya hyalina]|uniref:HxlR family transcriptional regulator n=1 Tax=Embleya hyalina TaxID=516124 RepID=A0A401YM75_9ACTN|nr:winged helix-turn-helix transcriptional regulator [Embleya hyalina]GCD95589.1 HxlR family transcriptional regulator [Embleya hyalina]